MFFTKCNPFFKVYNRYLIQYNAALATYKKCIKKNKEFIRFTEECYRSYVLDIPSILIMPVQRIPRYILLLQELFNHTPRSHPDAKLLAIALAEMKAFTEEANNSQKNYERYQAIVKIDAVLVPRFKNLIQPHRVLHGAGLLLLLDDTKLLARNKQKLRHVFLFNDLMLVTKLRMGRYYLKFVVYLNKNLQLIHFPEVTGPGSDPESCFVLRSVRSNKSLLFKARDIEDKMLWVITLERIFYANSTEIPSAAPTHMLANVTVNTI
jgi:hypothetical protein